MTPNPRCSTKCLSRFKIDIDRRSLALRCPVRDIGHSLPPAIPCPRPFPAPGHAGAPPIHWHSAGTSRHNVTIIIGGTATKNRTRKLHVAHAFTQENLATRVQTACPELTAIDREPRSLPWQCRDQIIRQRFLPWNSRVIANTICVGQAISSGLGQRVSMMANRHRLSVQAPADAARNPWLALGHHHQSASFPSHDSPSGGTLERVGR